MKISIVKRFYERNTIGLIVKYEGIDWCEEYIEGFWDILVEYFTCE